MTTMLELVQQTRGELGLPIPTSVIGNVNADIVQTLFLLNSVGYEVIRRHPWEKLNTEYRFTTVFYTYTGTVTDGSATITAMPDTTGLSSLFMAVGTGIPQDCYVVSVTGSEVTLSQPATASGTVSITFSQTMYPLPNDFDHLIDRTQWDKSQHWEMIGPETPQQWQWLKSGYIASGPRLRFRVLGGYFQIWPPPGAALYIGYEYVTKAFALSSAGTPKNSFTADTDTCIFSDRLMVLGTKKKYFEIKGFDTTALTRDYNHQLELEKSHDTSAPILAQAPLISEILIGYENIPDSGYGT